MSSYKLIIEEEKFPEDLIFTLKVLSLNSAQKDLSDIALLLPEASPKLINLLEEEKLNPIILNITNYLYLDKKIRYLFVLSDKNNRIKKMSVKPGQFPDIPGLTLIYTARFPCPAKLKNLPYFNAAASNANNYSFS